jgi:hypothetical protein
MNKYQFGKLVRITKHAARRQWGKRNMVLCPCNLRPGGPWHPELNVDAKRIAEALASTYEHERKSASFDAYVRNFEWYNCNNKETGLYTSFYTTKG